MMESFKPRSIKILTLILIASAVILAVITSAIGFLYFQKVKASEQVVSKYFYYNPAEYPDERNIFVQRIEAIVENNEKGEFESKVTLKRQGQENIQITIPYSAEVKRLSCLRDINGICNLAGLKKESIHVEDLEQGNIVSILVHKKWDNNTQKFEIKLFQVGAE